MTVEDFFDNDEETKFIDRICSFLEISTDRLKIVGARNLDSSTGNLRRTLLNEPLMEIDAVLEESFSNFNSSVYNGI